MIWLRRLAWSVAALLLIWVLAWLAVPPILKSQAQSRLGELLGRPVTIGAVDFKPWSLQLTVTDLAIGNAPGAAAAEPQLQLGRLFVDADIASVLRRAPVVEALEIDALRARVARVSPGHYDIDDLIAKLAPRSDAPAGEPARFALHNLQLRDARLRFDDQPVKTVHTLDTLTLALPFISNLPSQVDIKVEPHLSFKLNGTPFDSGAQATPFAQSRSGDLKLVFNDLDVAPYLGYLPESLPVRLRSGLLSSDLALRFAAPQGGQTSVAVQGTVGAKGLALADAAGAPLLSWQSLKLELRDVQPLARQLAFGTLAIDGARLHVQRDAQGTLNLQKLAAAPTPPKAPASAPPAAASGAASAASGAAVGADAAAPWKLALETLQLNDARMLWNDAAVTPAAALQLDGVALTLQKLQWPVAQPMPLTLSARLRPQGDGAPAAGELAVDGSATDRQAQLSLKLSGLTLDTFAPYVAQALVPKLGGTLALAARLDWSGDAAAPKLAVALDSATLDALRVTESQGRKDVPALTLEQLVLADVQLDLPARTAVLGSVKLTQPVLALARDRSGSLNATRWVVAADTGAATASSPAARTKPATPAKAAPTKPDETGWRVQLKELSLDGGQVQLADASVGDKPLQVALNALRLRVQDLVWPGVRGAVPARVQLAARVGAPATARAKAAPGGLLDWNGRASLEPLAASGALRIDHFPVHLFEPYFGAALPVSLLRADAGWKGQFAVQQAAAGWKLDAAGDVLLSDLLVHTRADAGGTAGLSGTDELLSWKALTLNGVKLALAAPAKPRVEIREATLADFYSRLVITEQGRFNLQEVAQPPGAAASAPASPASVAPAIAAASAAPAAASAPASGSGDGLPLDISVGATKLVNGRVDFSDFFVRPNYSARLSELNGQLGAFRSGTREMATLELRGRAAGTAALDISGQLNPTAQPLALDIRAKATDLELAPLSPYAGKYAGYAIERGKLSMDVSYKIDADGKLEAKNQVVLNQLTFGDKVDSPDATKLPVLLAVALLKDRNGVIDINLPVSGSIDDPQFSVGGIILKVIVNLLVKALTAPFALLAGGGSDDLSFVEFKPGTAVLTESGDTVLDKVAKALEERTALKMTVTGAADPASETEAFRQAALEARLLAERKSEQVRGGAAADAPVQMSPDDRVRLLKELYRRTDIPNKPRTVLGLARDISGPEMETLLKSRIGVNDEAMRELALQRGTAVRDALIARGLPSERLFLAAPKLGATTEGDAAWTPRVQLNLSAN